MEQVVLLLETNCKKKDREGIERKFIDEIKCLGYLVEEHNFSESNKKDEYSDKEDFYEKIVTDFEADELNNVLIFYDIPRDDYEYLFSEFFNVFSVLLNSWDEEDLSCDETFYVGGDDYLEKIAEKMNEFTKDLDMREGW